jgi:UDP-N-acetylglucosamine 3-dehydrogenase
MNRVKYAVIGLGFFGEKHVEVLSQMPDVDLVAICTRRQDRLKEIKERFGIKKTYTDYKELLANPEIDAVSIVTTSHREFTIDSLKSGKHVFVEKPMANKVEDCDAIIEASKSSKGFIMIGHILRFDPRVVLAKEAIDNGRIGKIVSMHATRNLGKNAANLTPGILDNFSPLMGEGIHDVDVMQWISHSGVKSVFSQTLAIRQFKYPDIYWVIYRFENGAIGVTENIRYLPEKTPFMIDARMEVIGTEGAIYINGNDSGLTINDQNGLFNADTQLWPVLYGRSIGTLFNELSYFVSCIRNGKKPDVISLEEAKMAVKVVCAAEESAATGKIVKIV